MPAAKRQRVGIERSSSALPFEAARDTATPQKVSGKLSSDETRRIQAIARRSLEKVAKEGARFLAGGVLAEMLSASDPALVDSVRSKLGGKGWLRTVMEAGRGVMKVEVPGISGHCYALSETMLSQEKGVQLPRGPPRSTSTPAKELLASGRSTSFETQPGFSRVDTANTSDVRTKLGLAARSGLAWALSQGHDYVEGSKLSSILTDRHPDLVHKVRSASGKGWLRSLMHDTPSVEEVAAEGIGEPCFSLTSRVNILQASADRSTFMAGFRSQPTRTPSLPLKTGEGASRAGMSKCSLSTNFQRPLRGQPPPTRILSNIAAIGRSTASEYPKAPWRTPTNSVAAVVGPNSSTSKRNRQQRQRPSNVIPKANDASCEQLIGTAVEVLRQARIDGQSYLQGNRLSAALQKRHPVLVEDVKAALGGKGWLVALMGSSVAVKKINVPTFGEPCYALSETNVNPSIKVLVADRADGLDGEEYQKEQQELEEQDVNNSCSEGEEQCEGFDESAASLNRCAEIIAGAALCAVADAVDTGDYLTAEDLGSTLAEMHPDEALALTAAYGEDDWVQHVLKVEPRIREVRIEGMERPCFRLSDQPAEDIEERKVIARAAEAILSRRKHVGTSELCELLAEQQPEEVQKLIEGCCDEHGWLQDLLDGDYRFEKVVDAVKTEPCYGLARGKDSRGGRGKKGEGSREGGGGKQQEVGRGRGRDSRAPGATSHRQTAEERSRQRSTLCSEAVDNGDLREVCEHAVTFLSGVDYLEGSKLTQRLKQVDPDLVQRIRGQMQGKGWVKTLLETESRIVRKHVPGRDEPCFALA
eukprot:TRINITY_DN33467_c0_g1_i1.p1 TRINITY_DN33467_c0_g1~~TRINITY_DN33467_c0_g1_i1.p1  ORF type:complete len:861 (-),score=149.20 TRINITY_DN33467_c0_g1_i1:200-2644(-)